MGSQPLRVALCFGEKEYNLAGPAISQLCVGFIDHGVVPTLITSVADVDRLWLGAAKVMPYHAASWPFHQKALRQVLDGLTSAPPHLVHVLSPSMNRLAVSVANHFDVPMVVGVLSTEGVEVWADYVGVERTSSIVASKPLLDLWQTARVETGRKATVVRPSVHPADDLRPIRQPKQTTTILVTGDYRLDQGIELLIRAVRQLIDKGCSTAAFLMGSGPDEAALRRLARSEGVSSSVFFTPPIPDWQNTHIHADIFVVPRPETAIDTASLHAMATGMAVVAVQGGIADHYLQDETALLIPEPSAVLLADRIERLIRDVDHTNHLRFSAQQYVRTHHQASVMASATVGVYRTLLLRGRILSLRQ